MMCIHIYIYMCAVSSMQHIACKKLINAPPLAAEHKSYMLHVRFYIYTHHTHMYMYLCIYVYF